MDGIGGIIIGNIFDISKNIFPESYVGTQGVKLYYTVTGVGQDVSSDGQWITTIEGNPFIPDSSFDISKILTVGANFNDYDDIGNKIVNYITNNNINLPLNHPSYLNGDDRSICMAVNKILRDSDQGTKSMCARYTYSLARCFTEARKGTPQDKLSEIAIKESGHANSLTYRNKLIELGYKLTVSESNLSRARLQLRLENDSFNTYDSFNIGDVVIYWSSNPVKGKSSNPYVYGHTQIFTGGVRYDPFIKSNIKDDLKPRWASFLKHNRDFLYDKVETQDGFKESWNYILFRL
jgi:hypothetical protein